MAYWGNKIWIYSYIHCNKDLKQYGSEGELITENNKLNL